MKNKYFKYSMILVALSVSVGVALFGFNTAFGVVTPTQTPETSSTVAPTFSGLKVTGTATLDKAVTVGSDAKPANLEVNGETKSNGNVDINGELDVETTATIHAFLYAWGDAIFNELLTVKKGLQVDGGNIEFPSIAGGSIANLLGFTGALNKNISLETKSPTGLLRSSLKIRGDGVINQVDIGTAARSNNLQVYGNIKGTGITGSGLTLLSDLENFSLNPNLGTQGPSSIASGRGIEISTGMGEALSVSTQSGPAKFVTNGTIQADTNADIGPDLSTFGIKVGIPTQSIALDGNEIMSNQPLYINWDSGKDVVIGGGAANNFVVNSTLKVAGKIASNLDVTGYIKIPSDYGRIVNGTGNALLQTWFTNAFGDYTAINSGYTWTEASEPVSMVAGSKGIFFTKGNSGTPYSSVLGSIDLNGNLKTAGNADIAGNLTSTGNIVTYGTLTSVGDIATSGNIGTAGDLTVKGKVNSLDVFNRYLNDASSRAVYVDKFGYFGQRTSSIKYKENVKDMENLSWFYNLRPVNFNYKNDTTKSKQYGLIAEEVEKVNPSFAQYDNKGEIQSVSYENLITPIIKVLQNQKKEIDQLKAALCQLDNTLDVCN